MRTLRLPSLVLATVVAAGCARCGSRPPPTERFVAADAAAVLIVPTLAGLAQQSSDVLTTAATFPGGKELLDARAVIAGRLTFDPFDVASIAATGLDPARGLALSGVVGKGGEQSPDVVLSLPVADAAKFEAAVAKLAKERLSATERGVESGSPEVIAWRPAAGAQPLFAYALVQKTALVSFGPAAVDAIRAAAAIPEAGTIASRPEYQKTMKALGAGLGIEFYVPANSPALKDVPQLKDGFAAGVRGGRDRIGVAGAMLLGPREATLRAAVAKGESSALLAKLDPGAGWVVRGDGDPGQSTDVQAVIDAMGKQGIPEPALAILKDFIGSLGSGSALGIGVLPPGPAAKARLTDAPLSAVRAELLTSLKDPARMTAAIQRAVDLATEQAAAAAKPARGGKGAATVPNFGKNPWRFPLPGGELAAAVADGKLAIVAGPAGTLEALLARTGTTFKGPTPAADKALKGGSGGMYIDVPKLAAAARAYPEEAFGDGQQGVMVKSMVDQWSAAAERITAISVSGDLVEGAARGELLVEVTPVAPAAK
jgi:hypothetical protein